MNRFAIGIVFLVVSGLPLMGEDFTYQDPYDEFEWVLPGPGWEPVLASDSRLRDVQRVGFRSKEGWHARLLELPVPYDLEQLKKEFRVVAPQAIPDVRILSEEPATVSGRPAHRYEVTGTLPGEKEAQKALLVLFSHEGAAYVIVCQAPDDTFEALRPRFDAAVRGFHLPDAEPRRDPFEVRVLEVPLPDRASLRLEWSPGLAGLEEADPALEPCTCQFEDAAGGVFQVIVLDRSQVPLAEHVSATVRALSSQLDDFELIQGEILTIRGSPAARIEFEGTPPGQEARRFRQLYLEQGQTLVVINLLHPSDADGVPYADIFAGILESASLQGGSPARVEKSEKPRGF